MKLTSRTTTHQIAYIAIMSAITIVLSVLANFYPFMSLLLILFLPFVSALVAVTCDLKFFPIYLIATILLSVVVDITNFLSIIFYLIPGLLSGLIIGVSYRVKINGLYMLLGITFVNFLSNFATIPVLDYIYQIDSALYSMRLIGFGSHALYRELFIGFLFIVALIQATLTYYIVDNEIKVFKQETKQDFSIFDNLICIVFGFFTVVFSFFHTGLSIVFFMASIYLSIHLLIHLLKENTYVGIWTIFITIGSIPVSFVLSEISQPRFLVAYLILQVLIVVIVIFLWEYIFKQRVKQNGKLF